MKYLLSFMAGASTCISLSYFKNGDKLEGIQNLLLAIVMLCLAAVI